MDGNRRLRRWYAVLALALSGAVALMLCWWPRDPTWTVHLRAEKPVAWVGESVQLVSEVEPPHATGAPEGWSWRWKDDAGALHCSSASCTWAGSRQGRHRVTVRVRTPWGDEESASTTIVLVKEPASPSSWQDAPVDEDRSTSTAPTGLDFGIAELQLEKSALCDFEETLVRLIPFHDQGEEAAQWLIPSIQGKRGWEVPVSLPPGVAGVYPVSVRLTRPGVRGDAATTEIYLERQPCVAPWYMRISHRGASPFDDYEHSFQVVLLRGTDWHRLLNSTAESRVTRRRPLAAAHHYVWSFGDGSTEVTQVPAATHRFPAEGESEGPVFGGNSYYTVTVEARDRHDNTFATTRTVVALANPYASAKRYARLLVLRAVHDSRARADDSGRPYIDVTLQNVDHEETAHIDELACRALPACLLQEGRGEQTLADSECDTQSCTVAATEIFDTLVIPPLGSITGRLTWPEPQPAEGRRGLWRADLELKGTSEPSKLAVYATFAIELSRGLSEPVIDSRKLEILQTAAKLLPDPGRIELEDIYQLEREGMLSEGSFATITTR